MKSLWIKTDFWKWLLPGGAVACYLLLVAKIATSVSDRFYTPVYAVIFVTVVAGMKTFVGKICINEPALSEFLIVVWIAAMLTMEWNDGLTGYLYRDSKPFLETMERYGILDALYVWNGEPAPMCNFKDAAKLKSITFFKDDVSELENMEELNRQAEYVLYVAETEDGDQVDAVMKDIERYCPQITECELIGRYGLANIYHIYGE